MTKTFASRLTLSLASLATFAACSSDHTAPSSEAIRSRLSSDLGHVLTETVAAADGMEDAMPSVAALSVLQQAFGLGASSAISGAARRLAPAIGEDTLDPQAIIDQLNTTVFIAANEVAPGLYDLPASLACGEPVEAECAEAWDTVDPRVRVEENGSQLRFAVQLGAAHDEPLDITLTNASLAVSLDLDEAQDAATAIALALGEQLPNANVQGQVTGTLTVLGTSHVSANLTIDRAIDIAFAEDGASLAGPDAVHLTSAAASVATLDLDGAANVGSLALALGATTAHVPGDDGTFDLDLPGVTATVAVANNALSITDVSLGDRTTTLTRDGAPALAIDLNPEDGRALDATLTADANGVATLAVTPKLDARIAIDHAALGDEAPRYDVTRVLLDGSLAATDDDATVRVATGTFSLTTNPASYGFTAVAGQCVAGEEQYDSVTFASYVAWTVGTCN